MSKFSVLYFATAGFYSLYWFYQCWAAAEAITGRRYLKVGRAAFAVLFVYELFQVLSREEKRREIDYAWQPARLAWVFIGAAIAQVFLTYGVEQLGMDCWGRLSVFVLVLVVQFYALYQAQLAVNRLGGDPFGKANQQFTVHNHLWIAVGFYLWFKLVSNCVYPPPPPSSASGPPVMPVPGAVR